VSAAPVGCLDEREAFEAWIRTLEGHPFAGQFANLMWAAWQASSASRQEGWISVDERMPPPITYVIAHGRRYGDREGHKRVYVTYTGTRVFETVEDEEIAYWMPLPAAPHQSQEAQGDRHGE